jgi:hypothetical protein
LTRSLKLVRAIGAGVGAVALAIALSGVAGATTTANYVQAQTTGSNQVLSRVYFNVNGQFNFEGPFMFGSELGPSLADPSAAYATSTDCSNCITNAIAININVVNGPLTNVFVPTTAVATNVSCLECNTLAADFTFVVSPGTYAALTSTGLGELSNDASMLTYYASLHESSATLATQVQGVLENVASVLVNDVDPPASNSPPQPISVQQYGTMNYSTALNS